jgi:photosystem II stability/assembly factor-like uncharacterized protein
MATQVRLLVGTKKAAFIYTSGAKRENWQLSAPIFTGWTVFNMAGDARGETQRIYAAANHWAWGRSVSRSTDLGATWDSRSPGLGFPEGSGETVGNAWCVTPGHSSEPGVVYCGTQPAGLFRSEDWGTTWAPVDAINNHESKPTWSGTGGGDSCLNSIEIDPRDPKRMYIAISAGGSFKTEDGGATWASFSHTVRQQDERAIAFSTELMERFGGGDMPDVDPLGINEMHKMRLDQKNPDRVWTQTHVGVFRSDDCGATWADVTRGLPSFHGFPIAVTKRAPDAAYVVPLAFAGLDDNFRVAPGQFAVWRTRDAGATWESMTRGLPGPHDYQSVYREGLDTDGMEQEGVYVGTSNGEVYASLDGGDQWRRLPGTLPPILSVTCAVW